MAITSWDDYDRVDALVRGHDDLTDLVATLTRRPAWHQHAACRGQGADLFFPTLGADPRPARQLCATCPVTDQCLAYAMADASVDGVWSSTTQRQRARLRADQQRRTA